VKPLNWTWIGHCLNAIYLMRTVLSIALYSHSSNVQTPTIECFRIDNQFPLMHRLLYLDLGIPDELTKKQNRTEQIIKRLRGRQKEGIHSSRGI
jgi:hypothetical protein